MEDDLTLDGRQVDHAVRMVVLGDALLAEGLFPCGFSTAANGRVYHYASEAPATPQLPIGARPVEPDRTFCAWNRWRFRRRPTLVGTRVIGSAGMVRSRLLTVVAFVGVLVAGSAWFTQCQQAANNVPVGGARVSCPQRPAQLLPSRQVPGTATTLVPGRPAGLLACRFHGLNQPQAAGSFAAAATFAPANFVTALNGATVPPIGAGACPVDFGEVIVLRFVYANGHMLTVNVDPAGCTWATNGDRTVYTPQSVLSALGAIVGLDPRPGARTP